MSTTRDDDQINDKAMPLMDHLKELRSRLLWSVGAFVAAFAVCYYFSPQIYAFLAQPLADILAQPLVRCDAIPWQMFGISMAGWNSIVSLILVGAATWLMLKPR